MKGFINVVDKVFSVICGACRVMLFAIFAIMWIVVFGRYFLGKTPIWGEELVLFLMTWVAMLSGADALRRDAHLKITILDNILPPKALLAVEILWDTVILVLCAVLTYYSAQTLKSGFALTYQGLKISEGWAYLSIPVGFVLLCVADFERLLKHICAWMGKPVQPEAEKEAKA